MPPFAPLFFMAAVAVVVGGMEAARRARERRPIEERNRCAKEELASAARELGLGGELVETGEGPRYRTFLVHGIVHGLPASLAITTHRTSQMTVEGDLVGLPTGLSIGPALEGRSQEDYILGLAVPAPAKDGLPQPFCVHGSSSGAELARIAETIDPKVFAFASALRGAVPYVVRLQPKTLTVRAPSAEALGRSDASAAMVRMWRSTEAAIVEGQRIGVVRPPS